VAKTDLRVEWGTHEAAKYAVENWHYSKVLPAGAMIVVSAYEHGKFIGAIIFSRGASPTLGTAYGLDQDMVCELTRVALRKHESSVSRIMSIAIKFLKKRAPGLRLIVSFADPSEGHHGGIYQACGWSYIGDSPEKPKYLIGGRWVHERTACSTKSPTNRGHSQLYKNYPVKFFPGKHRYLFPLDEAMRKQIAPLSKPYPKKSVQIGVDPSSPTGEQ